MYEMEWSRLFGRQDPASGNGNTMTGAESDADEGVVFAPSTGTTATVSRTTMIPAPGGGSSGKNDGGSAAGDGSNLKVVQFNSTNFQEISDRVIKLDEQNVKDLAWHADNSSVTLRSVAWMGMRSDRSKRASSDGYSEIARVELRGDRGQGDTSGDDLWNDVSTTGATLKLKDFVDDGKHAGYRAHHMVIDIQWRFDGTLGSTRSGVFIVADSQADEEDIDEFIELLESPRTDRSVINGQENPNNNGPSRGDETTASIKPTTSSASGNEDSISSDDGGGGGGGLSTGAIAGIAVAGGVVFLALLGGLIWFFMRRRRQNKARGYKDPTTTTSFIGGDKDAHQVVESPRSTYSNDQQVPLSTLAAGSSSHGAGDGTGHHHRHHDDDRDFAPYRDDAPDRGNNASGSRQDVRGDGADTPHGVSRSVAHLVEDGMTEDEIRRLEEEERQLDDAIQRHVRR